MSTLLSASLPVLLASCRNHRLKKVLLWRQKFGDLDDHARSAEEEFDKLKDALEGAEEDDDKEDKNETTTEEKKKKSSTPKVRVKQIVFTVTS